MQTLAQYLKGEEEDEDEYEEEKNGKDEDTVMNRMTSFERHDYLKTTFLGIERYSGVKDIRKLLSIG